MPLYETIKYPCVLDVPQIRRCEQYTMEHEPVSSLNLMERAGKCCTFEIANLLNVSEFKNVFVFCGTGNNGGDGLVIARHLSVMLQSLDIDIKVVLCQSEMPHYTPEMQMNLDRWKAINAQNKHTGTLVYDAKNPLQIEEKSLVIDAIFGVGLNKPASGVYASAIQTINDSETVVVAVDTPSGLFASQHTGKECAVVMADYTLSIQYLRMSFLVGENYPYYGEVHVVDINMCPPPDMLCRCELLTLETIRQMLLPVHPFSHKGTFGHGLLVAGSADMPGAAILSARAAMRGGLGKLTVHSAKEVTRLLPAVLPEAILNPDKNDRVVSEVAWHTLQPNINAIAVGPGLGKDKLTVSAIKDILDAVHRPLILDADALNMLAENKTWLAFLPENSILTPHFKEFERLAGPSDNDFDRLEKAKQFAQRYSVILILKGRYSVVTLPDGSQFVNPTGNAGMATAGSGDVLTGLLLALLAQGYNPVETALLGVFMHGLAGDLYAKEKNMRSMMASDLTNCFGEVYQYVQNCNSKV